MIGRFLGEVADYAPARGRPGRVPGCRYLQSMSEDLAPKRVAELLGEGETQLVDVREPYEHEAGRIAGDTHIELERLSGEADSLDRARPLVFYCRSGSRSAMAADAFRTAGYDAYNMAGGLEAWVESGLPIEPADGRVA
jgi:rhodanese-related sulfurtransferase